LPHHSNIANISEVLGGPAKLLGFIGSSRKDLRALPERVRRVFGRLLLDVQFGETPESARAFGEGVSGVMKLIEDYDGKTFRAAYTVEFDHAIFVLHVFQKKARRGNATPRRDIELVRARLRQAREVYRARFEAQERRGPEENPGA
jgi:phage-related protein